MLFNNITGIYFRINFYVVLNNIETVYKMYRSVAVNFMLVLEYQTKCTI
jgi:hypothetical protein